MEAGRNSTGPGEVSFSCYLGTAQEKFIEKLTDQYPNPSITSSLEFPSSRSLARIKTEEGEIGVFDAEKYYNMKLENGPIIIETAINNGCGKVTQVDLLHPKTKSRPGAPSVSSEASYNSQTAFLRTYQRNLSQNKQKKVHGKSFLSSLGCYGSCYDKRSVYTSQDVDFGGLVRGKEYRKESIQRTAHRPMMFDERKRRQQSFKVKDEFHKPSVEKMSTQSNKDKFMGIPVAKSLAAKQQLIKQKIEEESRPSLEVFGSKRLNKEVVEVNLERKLSMLTWDAIPKTPNLPTSSVRSQVYEDIESDASSDLFEIDNISGSTGQPVFRRQISDGMPGCITLTPYEPSETSIEWSVVTASAADVSVVSDYGEKNLTENTLGTPRLDKDVQGSRPSKLLLGCKSQKAVRVESPKIMNDRAKSHSQQALRSVAPMPLMRKLKADNDQAFDFP